MTTSARKQLSEPQKTEIIEAYTAGVETLDAIGLRYGISAAAVLYYAKTRGVRLRGLHGAARRNGRPRGPSHHSWRGGTKKSRGYIMVLAPLHPKSQKGGYILEHRLVLETWLKMKDPGHPALDRNGHLRDEWEVHHRDENKQNNSVENLLPALSALHARHHALAKRDRAQLLGRIAALESALRSYNPSHPVLVSVPDDLQ